MSKGQHGNREAKKPKKPQIPNRPVTPAAVMPAVTTAMLDRVRKK